MGRAVSELVALVLGLLLAALGAWRWAPAPVVPAEAPIAGHPQRDAAVLDAGGVAVQLGDYRRIASLSLVADHVLLELVDPRRVVAWSGYSSGRDARRIGGGFAFEGNPGAERILARDPDLVLLTAGAVDAGLVARLRERGVAVFDCGDAYGRTAMLEDVRAIGALVGRGREADAWADALVARLDRLAPGRDPSRPPRRALALSTYGDQLFAGTRAADGRASSYHDVLVAAGLIDVAANRFDQPWPQIPAERLRVLDPGLIVTRTGQATALRRHPALRGQSIPIIELDPALWDHPGPPLVEAAEALVAALDAEP